MTVAGIRIHVSREIARQVGEHLAVGWCPLLRRRGVRLPGGESTSNLDVRDLAEGKRIGAEILDQLSRRREFASRPVLIVLPRADANWLAWRLPHGSRVFAPPPANALAAFGFIVRVASRRRRGRRRIWADEAYSRLEDRAPIEERRDRQIRRYKRIVRLEDEAKNPI